jgi:hypothetical protein
LGADRARRLRHRGGLQRVRLRPRHR